MDEPSEATKECVLTPALLSMLQESINARSTDTDLLARVLYCAPDTVRNKFKRINAILGTHSRFEALVIAIQNNWVSIPSRSQEPVDDKEK